MIPDIQRTIIALASGARAAPRAILRMSGPLTRQILAAGLELPEQNNFLSATTLSVCATNFLVPQINRSVPVTVLYWPDERSYTGQPSAELHTIGSLPLIEAIIDRCSQLGAQPAERGEFTLRAFLSGKLDLTQAEAVLGVIEADSQTALQTALAQLGGNLAPAVQPLRERLVDVLAELEAGLDFVDEDIEFISHEELSRHLQAAHRELQRFVLRLDTRSRSDRAPRVVLVGLPNSGKSSLFNALSSRSLAIVADQPGTTRDYLEARLAIGKSEIDLIDTAGWEELQGSSPRAMAQQQLMECLESADVCVLCIDLSERCDLEQLTAALTAVRNIAGQWILVGTKADIRKSINTERSWESAKRIVEQTLHTADQQSAIITSSREGSGLDTLRTTIAMRVQSDASDRPSDKVSSEGDDTPIETVHQTAVRCRAALKRASACLDAAQELVRCDGGEELIAAELRMALDELSTLIGDIHNDDILGEIFSRFCIGK